MEKKKRGPYKKAEAVETGELCCYGCGEKAKYRNGEGRLMCEQSSTKCPENKRKNSEGGKASYKSGDRKESTQVYADLPQETKDRMNWNKKDNTLIPLNEVFIEHSPYSNGMIRRYIQLHKLLDYCCAECSVTDWQGKPIVLDLDHINGNNRDNRIENLRFLCPNCHSQTITFRGRNKNTGIVKVSDEELLTAYRECSSIRQTLLKVGLAAKGGNYNRVKLLIAKHNLE